MITQFHRAWRVAYLIGVAGCTLLPTDRDDHEVLPISVTAPSWFRLTSIGPSSVTLQWETSAPHCTVERSSDGVSFASLGSTDLNSWTDAGLDTTKTYIFRITARSNTPLADVSRSFRIRFDSTHREVKTVNIGSSAGDCAVSSDGSLFISSKADGFAPDVRLWRTSDWTVVRTMRVDSVVAITSIALSDDGSLLAVGGVLGWSVLRLSDAATLVARSADNTGGRVVAIHSGLMELWVADDLQGLQAWDVGSGQRRWNDNQWGPIGELTMHPQGRWLVTGGYWGGYVWDVASRSAEMSEVDEHRGATFNRAGSLLTWWRQPFGRACLRAGDWTHLSNVPIGHSYAAAFLPGDSLYVAGERNLIHVVSVADGAIHSTLSVHATDVMFLDVIGDGSQFISADQSSSLRVWTVAREIRAWMMIP